MTLWCLFPLARFWIQIPLRLSIKWSSSQLLRSMILLNTFHLNFKPYTYNKNNISSLCSEFKSSREQISFIFAFRYIDRFSSSHLLGNSFPISFPDVYVCSQLDEHLKLLKSVLHFHRTNSKSNAAQPCLQHNRQQIVVPELTTTIANLQELRRFV